MAYCTNCGTPEREGQQFCAVCGAAKSGFGGVTPMPPVPGNSWSTEARVLVGISLEPPRHSRWSVLFRVVLSIPLFFVAAAVGFVAFFATIAAWFSALFTGRVPDGLQRFLTNAVRLYCNVLAYVMLLSSRWPGVTFRAKPTDQVTIEVDHVRLRRWSVFFRVILGYPATIVGGALNLGSYPLLVVAWVWGIVAGREPRAIHQALALVLRYQIRLQAYSCLLTPTQPFRGFLGEGDEKSLSTTQGSSDTPLAGSTQAVQPTSEPEAPVSYPVTTATPSPLPTRWFVTKGARVLMILILVFSVPTYFLTSALESPLLNRLKNVVERTLITDSHTTVVNAIRQFDESVNSCPPATALSCNARAADRAYLVLRGQSTLLSNNALIPSADLGQALDYEGELNVLTNDLYAIESSSSLQSQTSVINRDIPSDLNRLNSDYLALEKKLGASTTRRMFLDDEKS